jgi:anti-sigma B factor antagonist
LIKEPDMGSEPFFTVKVESGDGVARLALGGDLHLATVPILNDHLARSERDAIRAITLDLREVTFVDSPGPRAFLDARARAAANGHQLLIQGATPNTRKVFEITGTDYLLDEAGASADSEPNSRLSYGG